MNERDTLDVLSEEFLLCDICQEALEMPKVLPCLHYFCVQCLLHLHQHSADESHFDCPTCRSPTKLPVGGVSALPTNFHITKLRDVLDKRKQFRRQRPPIPLVNTLNSMQETVHRAREIRTRLKQRCIELHQVKCRSLQEINNQKKLLVELAEEWSKKLQKQVESSYELEMKSLESSLVQLEEQINNMESGLAPGNLDPKASPLQRLTVQLDGVLLVAQQLGVLTTTVSQVTSQKTPTFAAGVITEYMLEHIFGRLEETKDGLEQQLVAKTDTESVSDESDTSRTVNSFSCAMTDDETECYMTDIAILPTGEMVCLDADNHVAKVFFESGQPKQSIGKSILKRPDKIAINGRSDAKNPIIYISDLEQACIFRFDQVGSLLLRLPTSVANPTALAVTEGGNIVISDWCRKTVHIVSPTGEQLHVFHTQMTWPVYLSICALNGSIVVSDWKKHHVRIFDVFGTIIKDYKEVGGDTGQIYRPNGTVCDMHGNILISDMKNKRVHMLSATDYQFKRFVATAENGIGFPTGLSLNTKGHLVVLNLKGSVTVLRYL